MLRRVVVLAIALLVGGTSVSEAARPAKRGGAAARRGVRRPATPPRQPVRSLGALYTRSDAAVPRYRAKMKFYARRHGGRFHAAPLKKRERAKQKVNGQFGGDVALLTDVVRGTIELPDLRTLYKTLADIEANERVAMVRDRVQNLALGYPHVNVRLTMSDGLIVETQLTISPYYSEFHGENGAHGLYEEFRVLDERSEGLTPPERARRRELIGIMRLRFDRVPADYKAQLRELQRQEWFVEQFGDLVNPS